MILQDKGDYLCRNQEIAYLNEITGQYTTVFTTINGNIEKLTMKIDEQVFM